ncbi:transporter substrate-binding domain-containing protein [Tianweitania sp. BSSL-BM11]|uniref:Transporter substrate-binding domain-containing protein n=1 Tax=Tianweitania aestuarii TaxID=2814886 RepID=A0ABS5RTV2_9HYPH|nr:transporter substrate-binding domain-containing protein [Tianweitania aestuarii]MBS9719716.1 transporter substrate-binding domain-containing protein [Tianweitania aestuarii]
MKKGILCAAVAAITLLSGSAMAAEKVKVGFAPEPYPPFWVPDAQGNWTGWEVEFIDAVCDEAELDCELVPVAWEGIIPALLGGKIDVIMNSMRINDERRKVIDFSDSYYDMPTAVVANKSDDIGVSPEDMSGKIIGVQVSSGQQAYANKNFASQASEIRGYNTQDEAYQDLAAGRIDVVLDRVITMDQFLRSDAGKSCCETKGNLPADSATLGEGNGAGLRKDETELKTKLNEAIAAVQADGTYAEISKKYFDFDISPKK